jgi:hypothetical protein
MKRMIACIFLLPLILSLNNLEVSAQAPEDMTSVEIGWDSDVDPMTMELDSNYNFELVIKFWVDNSRPLPVDVEFEIETDESFMIDDPEKVTVAANSNETFELTISGSGLSGLTGELHPSESVFTSVILTANLLLGEQNIGTEEIEKELQFSPVFGFEVGFEKGLEIKSGTGEQISLYIKATGNRRDAISKIDMSFRGCPQMDYVSEFFQVGDIFDGEKTFGSVLLSAPSSHPDKKCTFVVTVTSEGNGNSYTGELEFNVDAPDASEGEDKENPSDTESSDFEVEDNSLPAISSILCLITVLFTAIIRR